MTLLEVAQWLWLQAPPLHKLRKIRTCNWCPYETTDASNMNRHVRRMHAKERGAAEGSA